MLHETIGAGGLGYAPCRYGLSRIFFRGPRRALEAPYAAFIGGTETYGKFIEHPFPALCEPGLGLPCVNLGIVNAGIDVYVGEPTVTTICRDAAVTVLQLTGAHNLSNRFYKVHPRRNDRFLSASTVLKAIYQEVDFSEFTFTRHMLGTLFEISPDRFEIVLNELRNAWAARMRLLLEHLGSHVVLLWFSEHPLTDEPWNKSLHPFRADPLFVTREMVEGLRPRVLDVVEVDPSPAARRQRSEGMFYSLTQAGAAAELPSVLAHEEAAARLLPVLRNHLHR
ncbi:MAG: hypothetical protein GC146_15545 [Limimaricola sp.]|uniref:DUF6473 family protein n=1 Tax=Limimaricola sp. TaxID=2211665 RepID=UPI001DEA8114|nr:DUF6473 family protein [Limimaricola sp.]MBI1418628.1 hypothetical protein [Limimaricola sp.]